LFYYYMFVECLLYHVDKYWYIDSIDKKQFLGKIGFTLDSS